MWTSCTKKHPLLFIFEDNILKTGFLFILYQILDKIIWEISHLIIFITFIQCSLLENREYALYRYIEHLQCPFHYPDWMHSMAVYIKTF